MQTCLWKEEKIKKLDMIDFTAFKQTYLFLPYHQEVGSSSALAYTIMLIFNDTLLIVLQ